MWVRLEFFVEAADIRLLSTHSAFYIEDSQRKSVHWRILSFSTYNLYLLGDFSSYILVSRIWMAAYQNIWYNAWSDCAHSWHELSLLYFLRSRCRDWNVMLKLMLLLMLCWSSEDLIWDLYNDPEHRERTERARDSVHDIILASFPQYILHYSMLVRICSLRERTKRFKGYASRKNNRYSLRLLSSTAYASNFSRSRSVSILPSKIW